MLFCQILSQRAENLPTFICFVILLNILVTHWKNGLDAIRCALQGQAMYFLNKYQKKTRICKGKKSLISFTSRTRDFGGQMRGKKKPKIMECLVHPCFKGEARSQCSYRATSSADTSFLLANVIILHNIEAGGHWTQAAPSCQAAVTAINALEFK